MSYLPWSGLQREHVAIIDATSVVALCHRLLGGVLTTPLTKHSLSVLRARLAVASADDDPQATTLRDALAVLERAVLHEALVYDVAALESVRRSFGDASALGPFSTWLRATRVPTPIYERAERHVAALLSVRPELRDDPGDALTGFGEEKPFHDVYFERVKARRRDRILRQHPWLAERSKRLTPEQSALMERLHVELSGRNHFRNSDGAPAARVIFYSEAAANAGIPFVLHPTKTPFVKTVLACLRLTAADAVAASQRVVASRLTDAPTQSLVALDVGQICIPPLSDYILATAAKRNVSIVEATMELRASSSAKSCREWLHALQRALCSREPGAPAKAARALAKLQGAASRWYHSIGEYDNQRRLTTTFSVDEVPVIGWLTKAIGGYKVALPDYVLRRKAFAFMFEPYQSAA